VVFKVKALKTSPIWNRPLRRTFLAISSEYSRDKLWILKSCGTRPREVVLSPSQFPVQYSWQCVRAFLGEYYFSDHLAFILEILDISNTYNVMDLFEVQGDIIERRLLRPDKSKFLQL